MSDDETTADHDQNDPAKTNGSGGQPGATPPPPPPAPPAAPPAYPAAPAQNQRHPGYTPEQLAQSQPQPQPQPGYGTPQPGQPYAPGQPHPGYGPGAAQAPQPHPGYGPASGAPGADGAPPKKRGLGAGALIAIIGGGVALIIVIIVVIALVANSIAATNAANARKPSDTVVSYLTALSEGDAETALGLLGTAPDDDTLLTDEVLAASNELAPITDIEVVQQVGDEGSADVTVGYLLGGDPVQAEYSVLDYDGDGEWQVSGGTGYISTAKFDGIGLTVNGVSVEGDEVEVFPGAYALATDLPNFTLAGTTTVVVTAPFESGDTGDIEPVLSDEALQQFRSLVTAAANECLASTTLAAGCGLELPATLDDGTSLVDGTIKRTLSADGQTTLSSLEPTLSYDNPTLAQGDYIGSVDVTAQCSQGGASGTCDLIFAPSLGSPSVDMASDNLTVLWD
ncbi:hypothetical protein [Herbiconiux sp. YIM B11900]|uniref:hypothetical protein n=1 Tax=Herbiconiux sp. YIM B11900 TaxID=3404131 RepID=UPI003F842A3D